MRKEKDMTTEKRKHLAAWFSIIFIFVTLASLFYIVKEDCYPYLCSRTDDGEKMI